MTSPDQLFIKLEFDKVRDRVARHASSEPGREILLRLSITTAREEVETELSLVSEMKRILEQEGALPLEGIYPIAEAVHRAGVEGTILLPRELLHIGLTLKAGRTLKAFLSKRKEVCPLLWGIADELYADRVLEFNIDQAIDEHGAVRASASPELKAIRRSIAEKYDHLRRRLEGILRNVSDLGFSQDEIITTREGRMVIPVKTEHKNRVPGFIHSASSSGATVFVEPAETLELNNDIRSLHFQEQREVDRILRLLTRQVGNLRHQLVSNVNLLGKIDALNAKAKYSVEILGVQPKVTHEGPLRLVNARHPILLATHGYNQTVPLDLEIGENFSTLIISGPNAGGKSVALKCVGLLVLMVQAGLHIPASEESVIRIFNRLFVDIGDEQSIEDDLSTFSSHLVHLKDIAENADRNSIVLIDEIGSGTDPTEGGAIAAALLERLTQRGTITIATTHHSALKVFAHQTNGVENGAMEFDQEHLTPTYRFRSGVPGSSYALEMASRLGFGDDILARSRALMGHDRAKVDKLITELEQSVQNRRLETKLLSEERIKVEALVHQYEGRLTVQKKEYASARRKALEDARKIVDEANAIVERSVKQIREQGADKFTIKEIHKTIDALKADLELEGEQQEAEQKPSTKPRLYVGSLVKLRTGGETGEIVTMSPGSGQAVVLFGNVKMRVALSDLVPSQQLSGSVRHTQGQSLPEKSTEVRRDIDLRGLTGDEAMPLVDKFLDDALLAGLHRVDIIHGKGTGALRKKITDFLSHHPSVKSFRPGEWNEGGMGATVVELSEGHDKA